MRRAGASALGGDASAPVVVPTSDTPGRAGVPWFIWLGHGDQLGNHKRPVRLASEALTESVITTRDAYLSEGCMALKERQKDKSRKVRFSVFGHEMIEKEVGRAGSSGRIYLPPHWIGKRVKIVKVD